MGCQVSKEAADKSLHYERQQYENSSATSLPTSKSTQPELHTLPPVLLAAAIAPTLDTSQPSSSTILLPQPMILHHEDSDPAVGDDDGHRPIAILTSAGPLPSGTTTDELGPSIQSEGYVCEELARELAALGPPGI